MEILTDIMTSGFATGDSCFINWEKLTKKGNNALKDSERTNFVEWIQQGYNEGLRFVIVVSEYLQRNVDVNPLIVIQLPNKSDAMLEGIKRYLENSGITYENNQLAVWLSERKQNLEDIEIPNAEPVAVIIKQAVATGWDCPRAQILVKLRDNMSETFEIQTIGRIRRMPEAKHYENERLDCCYLYTLDKKFTEGVKQNLGKGALEKMHLSLKSEHKMFSIVSEYKTDVPFPRDAKMVLEVIIEYFKKNYKMDGKTDKNKKRFEAHGFVFSTEVVDFAKSGLVSTLTREQFNELNTINIHEQLNTHKHGREMHYCLAEIGLKITLPYDSIRTIVFRLFTHKSDYKGRILDLDIPELYAFVINNKDKLKDDVAAAMAGETSYKLELNKNIT